MSQKRSNRSHWGFLVLVIVTTIASALSPALFLATATAVSLVALGGIAALVTMARQWRRPGPR
jgi:membrane associated rhomboid family serine protease